MFRVNIFISRNLTGKGELLSSESPILKKPAEGKPIPRPLTCKLNSGFLWLKYACKVKENLLVDNNNFKTEQAEVIILI